jgi:hypothetical protein
MRQHRRGQSEVIAAMILIPLLIVVFSVVSTSIFKLNVTGVSSLASRARFEQERVAELLQATKNGDICVIRNTGAVDIEIVRVWVNENFIEVKTPIKKGESITQIQLDSGETIDVSSVDLAITSRGTLFKFKEMCSVAYVIYLYQYTYYNVSGLFSSENILNVNKLIGDEYQNKKIITKLDDQPRAVVYKYGDVWFYNEGSGWTAEYSQNIQSKNIIPDLDSNGVNELVVVNNKTSSNAFEPVKITERGTHTLEITFVDLLKVVGEPDVIYIYYKVITQPNNPPPQQISVGIDAILSSSNGTTIAVASGSSAIGSFGKEGFFVITGNVVFPVKAFEAYERAIKAGNYSLTLRFTIYNPSASVSLSNFRLEYIAVVGADFLWNP